MPGRATAHVLGGWEEHKKGEAGDRRERGLRGYWTVTKPPHTQWPMCPLVLLFWEVSREDLEPSPAPFPRGSPPSVHGSPTTGASPARRREHVAPSGNMPTARRPFLLGTRLPQPGPSISRLALKPGFLRQKSLLVFIPKWLPQCLAPQQAEGSLAG